MRDGKAAIGMTLNPDKYRHHFDGLDLTDEQKTAMCEAICAVAEAFADRAFGLYPSRSVAAANDNDSSNGNNVIHLFQQSANSQNKEPSAVGDQPSRERRRRPT